MVWSKAGPIVNPPVTKKRLWWETWAINLQYLEFLHQFLHQAIPPLKQGVPWCFVPNTHQRMYFCGCSVKCLNVKPHNFKVLGHFWTIFDLWRTVFVQNWSFVALLQTSDQWDSKVTNLGDFWKQIELHWYSPQRMWDVWCEALSQICMVVRGCAIRTKLVSSF